VTVKMYMRDLPRTPAALAAVLLLATGGCFLSRGGKERPASVDVTLSAAERLNPDASGESLPTLFRIHLLGSAAKAETAGYEELYGGAKEALGEDLLAVEEIVLSPGETVEKRIAAERPARALLVVGVFRRPSGTSWRSIVPIQRGRPERVTIRAEDYRVDRR
jgi:type VI secretion system protein VasD